MPRCHLPLLTLMVATLCENIALGAPSRPRVPAGMDPKKWATTNDTRKIVAHERHVFHKCTYPNDPTTMSDVRKEAKAEGTSEDKSDQYYCDNCSFNSLEDNCLEDPTTFCPPSEPNCCFGWFCPVNASGNSSIWVQKYQDRTCKHPDNTHTLYSVGIGLHHGTFEDYYDSATSCSPTQPPQVCKQTTPSRGCNGCSGCDDTCKDKGGKECCCYFTGNETIGTRYTYYSVEPKHSAVG